MKEITLKSGTKLPLMNLKGKDYLQVCWRVVWFREEHPDWSIETEYVYQNDQSALAKSIIRNETGRIIATAHKEESLKDFPAGYREKAETSATGRALALIGYGAQYEPDFDEGSRIVDSPIEDPKKGFIEPGNGIQREGYVFPQMPAGFTHLTHKYLDDVDIEDLRKLVLHIDAKYEGKTAPPKAQEMLDTVIARILSIENPEEKSNA